MIEEDDFEKVEGEAQTLIDASFVLEEYAAMVEGTDAAEIDLDATAESVDEMKEDLEEAAEVCKALSVSQTISLIQHGYVPDLESPEDADDEDDTDDMPSKTFG